MDRVTTPPPEDVARELALRSSSPSPLVGVPLALPGDAWERRLLVALAAHLPRQRWVAEVVERHLSANPGTLASDGAFGHPEAIEQNGIVPTLPEWSYFFHGCGCCLTHRDGTSIDVDFDESGAESIDPFFYANYLDSLPVPLGIESLLRRPEPLATSWMADLDGLRALGFIDGQHRFRITELGLRWAAAIGPALQEMAAASFERRRVLAILLGDQSLAGATDGPPEEALAVMAREAVATRASRLARRVTEGRSAPALVALAALGRPWAEALVKETLAADTIDRLTSTAIALVESWRDSRHDSALLTLAQRAASPSPPGPFVRSRAIEIIFGRYRADTLPPALLAQLLSILRNDGHGSEAILARHLFLLEPEEGLLRLSRALHHRVPMVRHEAAACLVVLGTAEAADILRTAGTEESKTALALVRGIEPTPGPEPVGEMIEWRGRPRRVFTIDEIEAASSPGWVKSAAEELTATFGPLLERWWAS